MKKTKIFYWTVTVLLILLIVPGAVFDIIKPQEVIDSFNALGYPEYLLPFIGVMKIIGVVAILQSRFDRLKEWAYAGLFIDVFGASYSHLANGDGMVKAMPALIGMGLVLGSYWLYHEVKKARST
ncbi:MAG: DoxX family protein [Bacteroidota bacterium]